MFKIMKNEDKVRELVESGIEISQFIYYFDVIGNDEYGYEVNNLCSENLFILGDYDFKDVATLLRKSGFAKKGARIIDASFGNMGNMIEIETTGGIPVGRMDSDYFYSEDMKKSNIQDFISLMESKNLTDTYGAYNMVVMMHV